jgi:hypothetical protein
MEYKDSRRVIIICIQLIICFGLLPARLSAQELTLTSGTTTLVAAGDAACVNQVMVNNNNNKGVVGRQRCSGSRAITFLTANTDFPNKVDLTTSTRFVKQFHVAAVQGAPKNSFLPVFIAVPVKWKGALFNDSAVPAGPLEDAGAHVDVNMFLRLTEGTSANPEARGSTVRETRFMGASHAGISGCLTVPTTDVKAGMMLATCLLAVQQRDQGSGTIYLSAIVETGRTYNIELELLTDLFSFNTGILAGLGGTLGGHPVGNFEQGLATSDPFGLTWDGAMSITVGTDFQSDIQALQDEITQLRADLNNLKQEFKNHTHVYLTGKGEGQNNTKVNTGPPNF